MRAARRPVAPVQRSSLGRLLLVILSFTPWTACRSGCGKTSDPATAQSAAVVEKEKVTAAGGRLATPVTLLQLEKSAYQARLVLTADAIYLLTMEGAFRLAPGQAPQESKLDLGDNGVATPSAFIYWSKGAFWLAPKNGGPPGRLADVKERPIFVASVDDRFAWIAPDEKGRHTVYTLRQGEPYAIHTLSGSATAATMTDDRVVFVERMEGEGWRLGSVARTGGPAAFTATRQGRYPATLAAAGDVYYYYWDDKKLSEVWAVSPDLHTERIVADHITCSPLAVADRLFCVSMEGLFEISPSSGLPKLVYPGDAASTTTLAVDRHRIVWVRDAGPDKLEVKLIDRNAIP